MITLNYPALKRLVARKLGYSKSLDEASSSALILHKQESRYGKPAIYLPEDLDLIIGMAPGRDEEDINNLDGTLLFEHDATTLYQFKNIRFIHGHLFLDHKTLHLTQKNHKLVLSTPLQNMSKAFLTTSQQGAHFFGHWLTDDLTLKFCCPENIQAVKSDTTYTPHQLEYSKYFGHHPTSCSNLFAAEMYIAVDYAQNTHKKRRYQILRKQLREQFTEKNIPGVVIKRGITGTNRILTNENEIIDYCVKNGFVLLDPETMSAGEIIEKSLGAKIVIGVEGSHMAHGIYTMVENGCMLVIQPPDRFSGVFKLYMDCLGYQYAMIVGKPVEKNKFKLPLDKFKKVLNMINP